MLTDIGLTNLTDNVTLIISAGLSGKPGSDYHIVGDVEGLGPLAAEVSTTKHATIAGGSFNSAVVGIRNIVVTVGFNPEHETGKTVQKLRRDLYAVAMPGARVRVRLYNDGVYESFVEGHVETNEPDIFSQFPQTQISIVCAEEPYLREPGSTLHENLGTGIVNIYHEGDVPWGLYGVIRATQTLSWIEIEQRTNITDGNYPKVRINHQFSAGHQLRFNTQPGSKEMSHLGSTGSWLGRVIGKAEAVGGNGWPRLFPGDNQLRVRGSYSDGLRWDLIRVRRYGGF